MRCARLLFPQSLSLLGRPIPISQGLRAWSVSGSRNAPGIVPPSRRRSGCSPAAPYPPARRIDCLQETGRKSTRGRVLLVEFNLHRDLYRRGVKLLTINKEHEFSQKTGRLSL